MATAGSMSFPPNVGAKELNIAKYSISGWLRLPFYVTRIEILKHCLLVSFQNVAC